MRCESILSEIYNTFDKSKLDPILLTFKSSEMLHEFYHKRIFELITASLQNEQEKTIQALLAENKQLSSINSELKQKIGQIQTCYQSLTKENSETLTNIATIENEIKLKNDENEKLNLLISQLQNQNEGFQHQVLQLQNENSKLTDKLNELANITILKDNEIKDKNEQINYFKENITHIKEKQNEMTKSLEGMIQQNYDLKNELDTKNNDLNELVKKIESLKFDKTSICTVLDDSKANQGKYLVTDGYSNFYVYSSDTTYKRGNVVNVNIPNGDYSETKYIIGLNMTASNNNDSSLTSRTQDVIVNQVLNSNIVVNGETKTLIEWIAELATSSSANNTNL